MMISGGHDNGDYWHKSDFKDESESDFDSEENESECTSVVGTDVSTGL